MRYDESDLPPDLRAVLEQRPPPGRGPQDAARPLEAMVRAALSVRQSALLPPAGETPPGTAVPCPACGELRTVRLTAAAWRGQHLAYWSDCRCIRETVAASEALSREASERQRGSRDDSGAAYDAAVLAAHGHLTLATFEPDRLQVAPGEPHPFPVAQRWLADALAQSTISGYRTGPPAALYFRGPRGRGKTHLAVAIALAAREAGRRIALVNEAQYLHKLIALPFGPALDALVSVPAERAWLTVYDDIGKRPPLDEARAAKIQAAWYTMIDPRYNARRFWTVFTSEKSLDELAAQGTIDESLYSRIYEMTRGMELVFDGEDQRLRFD